MEKNSKTECSEIEDILIQAHFEALPEQESFKIKEHLKSCADCKKYEGLLQTISNTIQKGKITNMVPDPEIHRKLIKNLPKKQKSTAGFTEIAKRMLDYRIPVYQVIAAFIIIFAMVFVLYPTPNSKTFESTSFNQYSEEQLTFNVFDSLQILHSKNIGKNIHEDSVLTSWFITF